MKMKAGVEQSVYTLVLLSMLPEKAVLPGDAISQQLGTSRTYTLKLLRKLVNADLISSTAGIKGGYKLNKKPEDISIYDVYLATTDNQSLYSPNGILKDMLNLNEDDQCCMLMELMDEAEIAWKNVLIRETIASLYERITIPKFQEKIEAVQQMINEKSIIN
ncbi:RrF2 family transcriptional regulator [Pontibacillus litoralis]|uniref:Transcriptional regulator n=1 Tax=Pontibacillus litoralis JSM 072002 TaxID=1385512 RepID=A0A0A5HSR3_9BACI|nr:Rrf2 family transcriptional regulator [Pontibacillus litoralis]KGX86687.1 transcriptional regulator [Pontibacillus litoralis JSM 072002]